MGHRHDVAIYIPAANAFYEDEGEDTGPRGGGAELQMVLLADELAGREMRVAQIVWPVKGRRSPAESPTLVERPAYAGAGRLGGIAEAWHIWRGMSAADADTYVFRGGGPQLFIGALFCGLHRRKLIFSSAIDLDFSFDRSDRTRTHLTLYRAALRRADRVVVQNEQQLALAEAAGLERVTMIRSFAETAEPSDDEPDAFLWIGRLVDYKRPLEYVRLAELMPDARFRMVYFASSETPPGFKSQIEEAADRVPNLELVGHLPRSRTLETIARAIALVSTSRHEGMPNVFLEAWGRGVPVISLEFDPDGLIESKGLGLVAGGDTDRLREYAESIRADRELRSRLGENARRHVREVHGVDAVGTSWAELVEELERPAA
jgi:glycosyltransferase involved in cell wall biosynthesis